MTNNAYINPVLPIKLRDFFSTPIFKNVFAFVFMLMLVLLLLKAPAVNLPLGFLSALDFIFVVMVLGGVFEEWAFRAVILDGLLHTKLNRYMFLNLGLPNILTTILFVAWHTDIWYWVAAYQQFDSMGIFILGLSSRIGLLALLSLCNGVVYERYRSVTLCIALHMMWNAMCIAQTLILVGLS